jgi:hypothetical protein
MLYTGYNKKRIISNSLYNNDEAKASEIYFVMAFNDIALVLVLYTSQENTEFCVARLL